MQKQLGMTSCLQLSNGSTKTQTHTQSKQTDHCTIPSTFLYFESFHNKKLQKYVHHEIEEARRVQKWKVG